MNHFGSDVGVENVSQYRYRNAESEARTAATSVQSEKANFRRLLWEFGIMCVGVGGGVVLLCLPLFSRISFHFAMTLSVLSASTATLISTAISVAAKVILFSKSNAPLQTASGTRASLQAVVRRSL